MEYEIRGKYFKWWNENSRKARRQRTKYFNGEWFQRRKEISFAIDVETLEFHVKID
jgi:hypothetical protein